MGGYYDICAEFNL